MTKKILSTLFALVVFASFGFGGMSVNAQVKKIAITVANFTPAPSVAKTYGEADLTLKVVNADIKPGSNCTLEYQPFGHYNKTNAGFQVLDTKPYDATNGCTLTFPKAMQKTLAYNLKFRAPAVDGKPYTQVGNNLGYAFKLGSMPVITVKP
jgi:hypothetical protein